MSVDVIFARQYSLFIFHTLTMNTKTQYGFVHLGDLLDHSVQNDIFWYSEAFLVFIKHLQYL